MRALILVDLQNDFCPGGALAVAEGDAVVPVANGLLTRFGLVVATQDWHPADHKSFASNHESGAAGEVVEVGGRDQILWPDHCVQDTPGAAFHPAFDASRVSHLVRKGTDPDVDSYSAFFDNARLRQTDLDQYLKANDVTEVYLCGLATDYCVKFSCLDALDLGYETRLVVDACRGVELKPGDVRGAIDEMQEKGATVVQSGDVGIE